MVTEAAQLRLHCDLLDWHPTHAGKFLHFKSASCFIPQPLSCSYGSDLCVSPLVVRSLLLQELEKSAAPEAPAHLKPRSGSLCQQRRERRGNDSRFLTQPITCGEMVAIRWGIQEREYIQPSNTLRGSNAVAVFLQSSPKPAPPVEAQCAQAEPAEDHDESCKLSMSEKLALFNKLSLPEKQSGGPAYGPPERRRQKGARYHTQPITVEEVSQVR